MPGEDASRRLTAWSQMTGRVRQNAALRLARRGIGPGAGFESRLLWIFGSPRSGSTWLLQMLGALPCVVPVNEPLIGAYLGSIVADSRDVRIDDLDVNNFTFERQRRRIPSQFFSEQSRDTWSPLLGKLIKTRLLAEVAAAPWAGSATTVVVKEPNGSQAADLILGALPRSRVLFLLRDGRDVVDSELAATTGGGWLSEEFTGIDELKPDDRLSFVVRSASKWLWRTQVVEEATRHHPAPTLTVRYEDLRADTLNTLGGVCEWLGLNTANPGLHQIVDRFGFEAIPPDARGPAKFFRAARPGAWRQNLTDDEQAAVDGVIGAKLRELGYE